MSEFISLGTGLSGLCESGDGILDTVEERFRKLDKVWWTISLREELEVL